MKNLLNRLARIGLMLLLLVDRTPNFGVLANAGRDVLRFNVDKFEVVGGFTIENNWTIDKTANKSVLNLPIGGSESVNYTITVGKSSTAKFSLTFSFSVKNQGSNTETISVSANVEDPNGTLIYGPQVVQNDISIAAGATYLSGDRTIDFVIPNFNSTKLTPFKVNVLITNSTVPLSDISGNLSAAINNVGTVSYTNQTLTVTDTMPGVGPWTFTAAGTQTYTKSISAGSVGGTHTVVNTATGTSDTTNISDSHTVTVNTINAKPIANSQSLSTDEDTPLSITLSGSDADAGQSISYVNVGTPSHGTLSGTAPSLTYTPDLNYNGSDSFTFRVFDGYEYSAYATISITVNPVNDAPVANDDSATTNEDTAVDISVLTNDIDVEGDPISITGFTQPSHGVVTNNGDGTLKYTPSLNYNGPDSFTYTINGGDTATVSITVNPINDAPVAVDDSATTNEDTAVDISVLTNDTDVEGDPISITGFTQPSHGVVTNNGDGTLKYTPSLNYFGSDSFTYTINGGDTATVSITVNPINDAPVAVDDSATTNEDNAVDIDVLDNDTDVEGDPITVESFTQPANGTVTENLDGTLKYEPDLDFNGTDSFTYTINGGDTATVTVTVNAVDDNPVAVDDTASTDEDTPVDIDVLANDTDVDGDPITVESFTQPANGTVTENLDGTLKYVPDPDFHGTDSFTYTINGGDTATVTVTVDPVNDAPVAVDDTATTDEDVEVDIDVLDNDTDVDGNPITVVSFTQPTNGTVTENLDGTLKYVPDPDFNGTDSFTYTINGGDSATVTVTVEAVDDNPVAVDDTATTDEDVEVDIDVLDNDTDVDGDPITVVSFTQPTNGTVTENLDGTLKYVPDPDFNGTDSFTYTINGGDTASVTVTVDPVNDNPVAVDDTATTDEDVEVDIDVLDNDTDVDGDPITVEDFTQPANGTVTENLDGTLKYVPDPDFNGTDSFTYTINGGDTATVTITVEAVDDNPVAVDDTATTDEDVEVDIDVLDNDTDVDGDPITVVSFTQPANGTVTENLDGTLKYVPDPDFNGTDSFTYTINGGDTATVTVTVDPVNDNPVAVDDTATTDEDVEVDIDVLDNDTDVDGDPITVEDFTQPANGTVTENLDGTLKYVPDPDFNGTDSFTYTINGGDSATVTVTVEAVDDNPVAVDDTATTDEDVEVDIDVLDNDTDVDGNPITVVSFTQPTNGTVTENLDGTLKYVPDPDFNGTDSFTYTINGGDTATVTITVEAVDDNPVAVDDTATTDEDVEVDIDVLDNDTDVDGDPITVVSFTQPTNGTVTENLDGTLKYVPDPDFNGTDSFTYTINGGDTATVTITVEAVDDNPVAVDDTATTDEDVEVDIDVLDNDTDVDGDPITVEDFTQPANGTVTENLDGTLKYVPDPDFNGTDSFTYTINGGDTATVTVTVEAVDDNPVAVDDTATTDEDVSVDIDVLANDTDLEGDPITVEDFTQPANGTVTENLDGTLAYTPDPGFSGTDSFTYTINGGDTATVTITVVAAPVVNLPPVAIGQSLTVITGGTLGGTVTATDPENDPLAFSLLTGPANGSLVFNVDGTFTYVHNGGPSTSDSFLFEVYDGTSTSNALVTITVLTLPPPPPPAANIPPVVVNGTLTTDFEEPISGQVSGSDADGDPLTFSLVGNVGNGTLVFNPDGSFTYTPNDGFDGSDSFTFIANDGTDDSNTGTFTINVSEEEIIVVPEEETPLVALPFDWFSWLAYLLAGLLAWLLAFLRPNMKYTLTDAANNQKVIRRRLSKPDEKTMLVELNDKDMVNLQTINVEFYKRLAKYCGDVTVNFQLNGKIIHSVIIPEGIDDSFETLIRL